MASTDDPVRQSLSGKTGVVDGYDSKGVLSLVAFTKIAKNEWGLVLIQPLFTALNVSQTAYIAILAVACLSVLIIGLTVMPRKTKEELGETN